MLSEILLWLVAAELLGLSAYRILQPVFRRFPDRGYSLSKVAGVYGFGFGCWLLGLLGKVPLDARTVRLLFALVASYGVLGLLRGKLKLPGWRLLASGEAVFLGLFLFFAILRALNPEIVWGEKPMDFTFLNYFIREERLPPRDPWAAGQTMHYYYIGTLVFSLLAKILNVTPGIAYNLGLATVGALFGSTAFGLFGGVMKRSAQASLAALCVTLLSNFEVLRLIFGDGKGVNFDTFWASSRVFTSPAFIEYPFWSFLFADLHAHMIALPWALLLFASTLCLFSSRRARPNRAAAFFTGIVLGGLFALNTWDFISYSIFIAVTMAVRTVFELRRGGRLYPVWRNLFLDCLVMALGVVPLALPFYATAVRPGSIGIGDVTDDFNTAGQFFRIYGHLVLVLLGGIAVLSTRARNERGGATNPPPKQLTGHLLRAIPAAILAIYPWLVILPRYRRLEETNVPVGIFVIASGLIFIGAYLAAASLPRRGRGFAAAALMTCGFVIVPAEIFYLMDRMNTIFKFYNSVGLLFATATFTFMPVLIQGFRRNLTVRLPWLEWVPANALALTLALPFVATILNAVGMVRMERVKTVRPSLDGQAFLKIEAPDELRLYRWMRENIPGTPTMLEAVGNSYANYTRVAMHTGIPALLGWDYHVRQRGTRPEVIDRRRRDIEIMYSTPDVGQAKRLLREYGIDLIVIGNVERETYGVGIQKFEQHPKDFPLLFRAGNIQLFATDFSPLNPTASWLFRAVTGDEINNPPSAGAQ